MVKPPTRKELERKPLADLHAIAAELGIPAYRRLRKAELVERILLENDQNGGGDGDGDEGQGEGEERSADVLEWPGRESAGESDDDVIELPSARTEEATQTGILDLVGESFGFLRLEGYGESRDDVYVSASQVRRFALRPGDEVAGSVRRPRRSEKHPALTRIESVNGAAAEEAAERADERPSFEELAPVRASETLSVKAGGDLAKRIDKDAAITRGGRTLISGPPGAGATPALREVAAGLAKGSDAPTICVLLIGVRPEEATEWSEAVEADVVACPFERPDSDRVQLAGLVLERAKRRVERGEHVVLLVDSLSALGRASPDAARSLFGAGRALADGGSLGVVATVALPEDPRSPALALVEELRSVATSELRLP